MMRMLRRMVEQAVQEALPRAAVRKPSGWALAGVLASAWLASGCSASSVDPVGGPDAGRDGARGDAGTVEADRSLPPGSDAGVVDGQTEVDRASDDAEGSPDGAVPSDGAAPNDDGGPADGAPSGTDAAVSDARADGDGAGGDGPGDEAQRDAGREGGQDAADGGCVRQAEYCDGQDNDCDGIVDNVDTNEDGIPDCMRIALFGTPGSRPTSDFEAWLRTRGPTVSRVQTGTNEPLTREVLEAYDVIILDELSRSYTSEESALIAAWVEAGGGLMSMTGYTYGGPDRTYPNSLLAAVGLEYLTKTTNINGPVTTFAVHPLTVGITSITFLGGYPVGELSGVTGGSNTVIARLGADLVVGIAQQRGQGRVFVWGDEWISYDSEWRTLPEIEQFWGNTTSWLFYR